MTDKDKIKSILLKLPGFVLDASDLDELAYTKEVSVEEVEDAYDSAVNYATSFCYLEELPIENPIVNTAVEFWAAGLIWKKYDVRPNDQEDETNTLGYGDTLIIQAKQMLKPYKYYEFEAW